MNSLSKFWAIEERAFAQYLKDRDIAATQKLPEAISTLDQTDGSLEVDAPYVVVDGVAIIPIVGVVQKYDDIYLQLFGGCSTMETKANLVAALEDDNVQNILLYVDSPGGECAGTSDLADVIATADKRVWAFISDCGASAAYWIVSQAEKVFANKTAYVGSIGTLTYVEDSSRMYTQAGIDVHLIRTGPLKGTGVVDGVAVSDAELAEIQSNIDSLQAVFSGAIASGRGLSVAQVAKLATGQCWIGAEAVAVGLVDQIASVEDVLAQLSGGEEMGKSVKVNGSNTSSDSAKATIEGAPVEATPKAVEETPVEEAQETAVVAEKTQAIESEKQPADEVTEVVEAVASVDVAKQIADARAEGYAEAQQHEKQRLEALLEISKGDASFAVEQFNKGHDRGNAAVDLVAHLQTQMESQSKTTGSRPARVQVADKRVIVPSAANSLDAEWDSNAGDCQQTFKGKKDRFVAYRKWELAKAVK